MRVNPKHRQVPDMLHGMKHRTFSRLALALLALSVVGLACAAPGRRSPPTPTAGFATATPGGSISVWLISPTAPGEETPQATLGPLQATPIGPVATATALAEAIAAATATAQATPPNIFATPARCPVLGSPPEPDKPARFSGYAEAVAVYLSLGGPPALLEGKVLRSWGAISDLGGLVRADRDFTGDGVPEVLVVMLDPTIGERIPPPGDLYVFGCLEGSYRLLWQAGYAPDRGMPLVLSADDINGDGINDLVYVVESCEDVICYRTVHMLGWSLTLGSFQSMLQDEVRLPFADISLSDENGDGVAELVVVGGGAASPEAGPQHQSRYVYGWDGEHYGLIEAGEGEMTYRIHRVHEADAKFEAEDYEAAIDLYKQVVRDDDLLGWIVADEREYLTAYARYRMVLAYAASGQNGKAEGQLNDLLNASPPGSSTPGAGYAEMAQAFWDEFSDSGKLGKSCQVVVAIAEARADVLGVLNSYGYSNRTYTAGDMCPF
jgi:hypothetical protein